MGGSMNTDRIPQTDSIEELARFWQAHDLADFEDELEEPGEPVFRREAVVTLHLPSPEADLVEQMAASRGVKPAELIREWVAERVRTGA
jgi:hypothetical protein